MLSLAKPDGYGQGAGSSIRLRWRGTRRAGNRVQAIIGEGLEGVEGAGAG